MERLEQGIGHVDKDKKIVIIDSCSSEFNRGSYCYSPYLVYSAAKTMGYDVELFENFSSADIDTLPKADIYLLNLSMYPQIEHVRILLRFLTQVSKNAKVGVFGYNPIAREWSMPQWNLTQEELKLGLTNYINYFDEFNYILLSDCDMHFREYDGQLYPLFTTYGCPNGCAFCPATVQQKRRIVIELPQVYENLKQMHEEGRNYVHYTDEDLLYNTDRAKVICDYMTEIGDFKAIALASRKNLNRFIEKYGNKPLVDAGFMLFEVGLESAEPEFGSTMGSQKSDVTECEELANKSEVPILWLTLSFFPGETIRTLNATGDFLKEYGFGHRVMCDRLATNGTRGSLGQFFQPYHGTPIFKDLEQTGIMLSYRPVRLVPSFIPYSFLRCKIEKVDFNEVDHFYYDLYEVPNLFNYLEPGKTIEQIVAEQNEMNTIDACISLAISARLKVIT